MPRHPGEARSEMPGGTDSGASMKAEPAGPAIREGGGASRNDEGARQRDDGATRTAGRSAGRSAAHAPAPATRAPSAHGNWRFWLIGSYVVIVAALFVLWGYSLFTPIDQAEEDQQYASLESVADAASVALETSDLPARQIIEQIGDGETIRATLIDEDGTVLADSYDDALTMENHASRPEVQAAMSGQTGRNRRTSETDGVEYLYVAIPVTYQDASAVLRVSTPVSQVNTLAQTFRDTGLVLLAITIVFAIVVGWVAFRRTERPLSRLERVRTDFVANASHELKTPVAGIKLLSESIEQACKDGDEEVIPVFAERLNKESTRLQNLVTALLDLSRLENGGLEGRGSETCELTSIVSTSYEGHLEQARAKGISFRYDDRIPGDEHCRINLSGADASLIVDNLFENAISYTEEGGVTATLSKDGDDAVLTVADTGIGIPAADQERIFERFYRVDTARSREMGGTGLGLSLVRHALNRAGGTIGLQSEPGRGSVFTVTIPKV